MCSTNFESFFTQKNNEIDLSGDKEGGPIV
jgi:hypothetical protein